jgi:amino acid adenylation domain-containing protein
MSFRGAHVPIRIPHALQERLEALARREGATLFMVVLAAFQALLARAGGGADVVVGTTIAGRTRAETEPLIGLFMNTLVLRTDLSGDPDFREVLRRVREVTLGAYEHQDVPFERLVEELRPARSLSHSPLFQVLFELHHDAGGAAPGLPGLALRPVDNGSAAAKVDLGVSLRATPRGLLGELTYAADLFEPGTARRMVEQLERVLKQVATEPECRLSRLELMGRAERKRLLEWNRTTTRYPATRCIHQLFEDQADRTPGSEAVRFEARSWSYGELEARANQLAHRLRRMGVGPEVRVGICMERGLELMACILGVMKAGGAYVPADPAHPAERIAWVLEDSAVAVLLTQERLRERIPAREGMAVLAVDAAWEEIAAESAERPESGAGSENLAYVIYTSGSTGRPKGVAMHHRGVCNYIHWGIRAYGAERGSGAPVFSSMAVDLTITNLLPLFAGRPVRFLPEENPVEALAEVLREEPGFGLIKITPVHLSLLTPLLTPGQARAAAHTLVIGADFLSAEPTLFWQEHAPGVRLMNEYGPTETVVGCSAYVLPGGRHRAGPVPVGRPIQNLAFYVFDAHLEPVPVGLPGELYIGGAGVARGYLGRPGLTAEKFVPDPFGGPGARMYRTGDRARWQADGNLMVLGRTDNQVKIRGYRVELGEIETVLRRHDGVRGALAVVREDRPGDRRLVAYVVGDAGTDALRAYLRQALPEYMVPDAFVHLESLPQTATGKLDPRALPAPRYVGGEEWDEPRNYVEARLIPIWEELLGVEGIGPSQSFFELGGNSLLALRLFIRVNRQLECDLPVATLFAGATVRHMADAILEQKQSEAAPGSVVPLQPGGTLPPVFFVHAADRDVMGYVNLVRHLGADQPAYGVRDVGRDLGRPVEQIAAEHVAAIREVQPHGPYQLVSWSFGGIVAFEMACQLEAAGETVGFVGMLDTVSPALMDEWGWERAADVFIALAHDLASVQRRPFALDPAALDGLDDEEQARRTVQALREQDAAPPVEPERLAADLLQAFRNVRDRTRSYSGYRPGVLGAPLALFRAMVAEERRAAFFATRSEDERRALGWSPHAAGPVEVHHVPGSHMVIASEPHVRVLARLMRESLAAAAGRLEAVAGAGAHG